jgi:hypothetical protein
MLAHTSGAADTPNDARDVHSQRLYERGVTAYAEGTFQEGEGEVRRGSALILFVLGESVLASLSFGVAAIPALLSFLAGGVLLLRG